LQDRYGKNHNEAGIKSIANRQFAIDKMEIILKYFSDFTPIQLKQFAALDSLYKEWNSKINVISRKDIDGLYEKHVLHSLAISAAFQFEPAMEILDIGTGGGFPGIPLAIFFPEVKFLLADSIAKKLKVVDAVVEALELKNVATQCIRVEEIKNRKFDFVVSRAVAPLKELWRWSKPLLKKSHESLVQSSESASPSRLSPPGLICLKGGDLTIEIHDSGTRPRVMEISDIFDEEYFKMKYLLFVSR
jgi:16S rRNA (guanine527-N7)-methyltransferase